MRVIIAGSRHLAGLDVWASIVRGLRELGLMQSVSEVVSGGAQGVDAVGETYARRFEIPVKRFPANWHKHGRAAGPIRNQEMAEYADALVAIWDGRSRGTADMIRQAERFGLKISIQRITE